MWGYTGKVFGDDYKDRTGKLTKNYYLNYLFELDKFEPSGEKYIEGVLKKDSSLDDIRKAVADFYIKNVILELFQLYHTSKTI